MQTHICDECGNKGEIIIECTHVLKSLVSHFNTCLHFVLHGLVVIAARNHGPETDSSGALFWNNLLTSKHTQIEQYIIAKSNSEFVRERTCLRWVAEGLLSRERQVNKYIREHISCEQDVVAVLVICCYWSQRCRICAACSMSLALANHRYPCFYILFSTVK